jgi:hypothetical protein
VFGTIFARIAALTIGLIVAFGMTGKPAGAALDMVVGARNVVNDEPLSSCDAKARQAFGKVFGNAGAELGDTHQWKGTGEVDAAGNAFAAAAIHCYPLDDKGYVVTFTCAAQTPPAAETASVICQQLAAAFGGGQ